MKLSIIYLHRNSESRETIKDIITQLNDECELIISTQNSGSVFKEFKADNVKAVKQKASLDFKNALKAAQGDYITFVFVDDKISADYVNSVLTVLKNDDKAYYPLKWRFVDWHNLVLCGSDVLPFLFANIYKKSVLLRFADIDKTDKFYTMLAECESGAPVEKIIYMHWRGR